MKARLVFRDKTLFPDGAIVEMVIWQVPERTVERRHGLKYRLYYGRDGERIVGYDNELGKGDHRHVRGKESKYSFSSVERLISDFLADVERERSEE
jgi:hypothetical protein